MIACFAIIVIVSLVFGIVGATSQPFNPSYVFIGFTAAMATSIPMFAWINVLYQSVHGKDAESSANSDTFTDPARTVDAAVLL